MNKKARLKPAGLARALGVGLALIAGFGAPAKSAEFDAESFKLDNGLEVVVIEDHRSPVVTQMLWYKVGAADEPEGKSGVAHYLEHLMFKGTEKVPSGDFSHIVARNGGQENAFTAWDYTAYFQKVSVDRLGLVMSLEADRMANLTLTDREDAAKERDVVIEERRMRTENNPGALLSEQVGAALFLTHPYRIPIIGWMAELRRLTVEDAMSFYRAHYRPNNAVLVVAGDITVDQVRGLAQTHYGSIPAGPSVERVRADEPPHLAARRVVMKDARVNQPSWQREYLAPSARAGETRLALPLEVLADVLGGGPTSRLYRALIVEKALAAGIDASYSSTAYDSTSFSLGATPAPGVDAAAVEAAIDEEIARLLVDGVTEAEVDRAKRSLIAQATFARDSGMGLAYVYGGALTTGQTIDHVRSWPSRVEAVTAADVNEAARHVFRAERSVTGLLLPAKE